MCCVGNSTSPLVFGPATRALAAPSANPHADINAAKRRFLQFSANEITIKSPFSFWTVFLEFLEPVLCFSNISDKIFNERPIEVQVVATISMQSAPMINEQKLRTEVLKLLAQPEPMSRPKTWHAYHIEIETIEFWHGSKDRFHHRLRYELKNKIWQHLKLQP